MASPKEFAATLRVVREITDMERRDDTGSGVYTQLLQQLRGDLLVHGAGYKLPRGGHASTFGDALVAWQAEARKIDVDDPDVWWRRVHKAQALDERIARGDAATPDFDAAVESLASDIRTETGLYALPDENLTADRERALQQWRYYSRTPRD